MPDRSRTTVEAAPRGRNLRLLAAALLGTSLLGGVLLHPPAARAEVATDGTVGRRTTLRGQDVSVGADLGRRRGGNLFHSFERFGVPTNGSVTFTGPSRVENIIGRVTGGERSDIDGTLRSTIDGADLYLVNPAGILFGPNARLDVKGSFHASTADELRFTDGAVFSALDTSGSRLSVAEPQAFGFLGGRPNAIAVEQSVLEVPTGEAFSLVGGDVTIVGGPLGRIEAEAGLITTTALGGAGSARIGTGKTTGLLANIRLTDLAVLQSSGDGGGTVRIRGGNVVVEGSSNVFAVNTGSIAARGGVSIDANTATIVSGSQVLTGASASGDAGAVTVTAAGAVDLREVGVIRSLTTGAGDTGAISVTSGELELSDGGLISTNTLANASGDAGAVTVETGRLLVDRGVIGSQAAGGSSGDAGAVKVNAAGLVEVRDGGVIISSTLAEGDAGRVTVEAGRLLVDDEDNPSLFTGIGSQALAASSGDAGMVTINVTGLMDVRDGGQISSSTFALGDAGAVTVEAGRLLVDRGGSTSSTGINSQANDGSSGDAGAVSINARQLEIRAGGQISSSSFGAGRGGGVTVDVNQLLADGEGLATTIGSNADRRSSGDAGSVTVNATGLLELRNGGGITTGTFGAGMAGEIAVRAEQILIDSDGSPEATGINSQGEEDSSGDAGRITVAANTIEVRDGGQISSGVLAGTSGDAGDVIVEAGRLLINGDGSGFFTGVTSSTDRGSTGDAGAVSVTAERISVVRQDAARRAGITSDTNGSGSAGTVTVVANDELDIRDGGAISSSTFDAGAAGTVTVSARALSIDADGYADFGTGIFSQAEPGSSGPAGQVTIVAEDLQLRGGGEVASSTFGPGGAGSVLVTAGDVLVSSDGFTPFATGILSQANPESSGAAGLVAVVVNDGDLELRGDNGLITSRSLGTGNAGGVGVNAPRVLVRDGGSISSESTDGQAGVVLVQGGEVEVENASIRTSSQGFAGGLIQVTADDLIRLDEAEVTTNGVLPSAGASLIRLEAPDIILDDSRVTSLTGDGQPLTGSGEALLLGERTVISADSFVAGSSAVEIAGLQQNLGSGLQLPPGAFLDTGRLLRESCASRGGARSSFTRSGRGGLPAAPDRPLGSAGAGGALGVGARASASEPGFLDVACGGRVSEEAPHS